MRVPLTPDANEPPPPPYTRDPNAVETPADRGAVEIPIRTSLRGGYVRPDCRTSENPDGMHRPSYLSPTPCHQPAPQSHHHSASTTSNLSLSSTISNDLEGCTPTSLQSALKAHRTDSTKVNDPHSTIIQLLETFHTLRQNMSAPERKDLKKKHKSEIKAVKKGVKNLVKDIKSARKESHRLRRDERRPHLEETRGEENVYSYRNNDE